MRCIQVPDIARMLENVNSRKLGTLRELKLSLHGVRPVMTGIGSVGGYTEEVGRLEITDLTLRSFVAFSE
jgi:hypothetical protein